MNGRKYKVMLVAGEVSGDIQGASLAKILLSLRGDLELFGTGGSRMEKVGVELISSTAHLSSIGIIEALGAIPQLSRVLERLIEEVEKRRPDLILLIDNQGFNLQLAKRLSKKDIPILYWFPPQVWAFAGWQAKKIARLITHILAVFRFEEEVYLRAGARVSFVGHPFLDTVKKDLTEDEACSYFGLDQKSLIIGLLPGSRTHEISRHLGILLEVAKGMHKRRGDIQYLLPVADPVFYHKISKEVKESALPILIVQGHFYDALGLCHLLITASGSATLEAAILRVPMVIIYKTSNSTWFLAKLFVKSRFVGMPNILAKKMIVPELLQKEVTPQKIAEESFKIIEDPDRNLRIKQDLAYVAEKLEGGGGLERAAKIVMSYL